MVQFLKQVPVNVFTFVMGVGGLSIAYQRYSGIYDLTPLDGLLLVAAFILFICASLAYAGKWLYHRAEVTAEFNDPGKVSFFAAISISLLVLAIGTFAYHRSASLILWAMGTVLQLGIMLVVASRWIVRDFEITHLNPAWFLPAAGSFLVPIGGDAFAPKEVSWFFFSIGLFFWVVLFIVLFYRLTFHRQLVEKMIPTLFILIAPPALGFLAYMKLTGSFDTFAHVLLNVALFILLLLLFTAPYFLKVRFSISWWAYTFPLCIATSAAALAYEVSATTGFAWLAAALLGLSTLAVLVVSARTTVAVLGKTIFEE